MKTQYILLPLSIITFLLCTWGGMQAQTVFKHTVSKTNTKGHISAINHASTNGKKDKILIVTHDYSTSGPYQARPYGVWYNGKKWTIFNQDTAPIATNTKFNVMVVNKSANAFVVKAGTNAKAVRVSHAKLNKNPNAAFLVTSNWGTNGPYNKSPFGVYYSSGSWYIFNTDGKIMPKGAKFNVVINSKIFKHKVSKTNRKNHITYINNTGTNKQPKALVFATFNSQNSIKNFNNRIGVWYSANKWTVYNENRKPLSGNEAYNIFSSATKSTIAPIIYRPAIYKKPPVVVKTEKKPAKVNHTGLKNIGLVKYIPIRPVGTTTSTNKERQGPDITKYEDIESTLEGDTYVSFIEKLNVFRKIYKDKNTNSNVYYYFPAEYTLKWNKETNKYAFNIYYMSSEGDAKKGVLVNAELTPQVSSEDIKLAEKLLASKLRKPVKLMPMDLRDVPKVDFGATLTNFNVKAESINASIPSDYHKPIILDWRMDSNVDDFVGAMLNNIGVNINLEFRPYGDETTVINVPVNLEVNSPLTYGKVEFNNTSQVLNGWSNNLDYPVIPKNLVLLRKQGNRNYFEIVPLDGEEVARGETMSISATARNAITNKNNIVRLWLDYALNKDCNPCNQDVKKKIIRGTSNSQIKNLEIQVLNVLEYTDAHSMKLIIKSIQADPNGISEVNFPAITIDEDDQTHEGIQLFVPEGQELFYEYQLITIKKNGEVTTSAWQKSNSSLLVLGESQINAMQAYSEKSDLEKAKDSIIEKGKEKLVEKGKDILEDIFKKKEDKDKENTEEESN